MKRQAKKHFNAFNLNDHILIQITQYGWEGLAKYEKESGNIGFTEHCIENKKVIVGGVEYYKLQAHSVINYFGRFWTSSSHSPIKPSILVPKQTDDDIMSIKINKRLAEIKAKKKTKK